ncbi:MAG: aminopeptidase [Bacteroidales bacterium]|jgi:aminopeptidase C|nr:aminopeptidase [Bacteroidales bacterium]
MKRIVFLALLAIAGRVAEGRESVALADSTKTDSIEGFRFTTVDSVAITSVKNQKNAGTCWSYSGMSFLESEALRKTGKVYDFSEMFVVENTYMDRADKAVRTHGDVSFSQGGSFADVFYCLSNYGLVPDAEMPAGAMYGDTLSNHKELSAMTDPLVKAAASATKLQFSPDGEALWKKAVRAVHEIYLGKLPEKFTYEGKQYTPQSFAASTGLSADDYVSLTSFTHHPYSTGSNIGRGFIIEVQDNWRWAESLNLELADMMRIIDNALANGYSVLWGGDVSEDGFTRDGLAVWPDMDAPDAPGQDQARWLKLDRKAKGEELTKRPLPQKEVTAESRQRGYDNFETGDDHGMHIFGTAKDQNGNRYYMVKNSWGKTGKYNGIWYMTPEFCRAKTMNFVVNKNAIPKDLRKKYGIK